MALRDLLAAIEAEATADVGRLRAERDRQAAAIIEQARHRARELEMSAVAAADQAERRAGERRLAAARERHAARLRESREAAYQRVAGQVRAEVLAARDREDYPAIMAALLREARSALPAGNIIGVARADEHLVRRLVAGEPGVIVTVMLPNGGGVTVTDSAGAVARNTLEDRLAAAEPELRRLVGEALTGEPGPVLVPA